MQRGDKGYNWYDSNNDEGVTEDGMATEMKKRDYKQGNTSSFMCSETGHMIGVHKGRKEGRSTLRSPQ